MKCLLDTHAFLWMVSGDERLSVTAGETILDPATELYFSMASYWEICIKLSIEKLQLSRGWPQVFEREMTRNSIQWLSMKPEHAREVINLPWHHRDPFDRLIVGQCRCESLCCITADSHIRQYRITCVW